MLLQRIRLMNTKKIWQPRKPKLSRLKRKSGVRKRKPERKQKLQGRRIRQPALGILSLYGHVLPAAGLPPVSEAEAHRQKGHPLIIKELTLERLQEAIF